MNFLSKILRRLFPMDGQLRIAVYDDGHAQIQEYCGYAGRWQTYCTYATLHNGYKYHNASFNSLGEAKQAYDALMEDRNNSDRMHSIVKTYP